jgi:hypothetical protein
MALNAGVHSGSGKSGEGKVIFTLFLLHLWFAVAIVTTEDLRKHP